MPGTTKKRHDEIQSEAMKIVSDYGIEKLDALAEQPRRFQLIAMAHQLKAAANIADWRTARAHIAKACRRSRYLLVSQEDKPSGWGGKRPGAGRRQS